MLATLYGEQVHYKIEMVLPKREQSKVGTLLNTGEHQLIAKSADGLIELEDGTQFKVLPTYWHRLEGWDFYDLITFIPNHSYFDRSEFYILNKKNGEHLRANIWASPAIDNPHALHLVKINTKREEVTLSTPEGMKMRWKIDSGDFNKHIQHWEVGDMIIIGKNSNHFPRWFENHPYILVSYAATEKVLYLRGTPNPL